MKLSIDEQRIGDDIVAAGAAPRDGKEVVFKNDRVVGGIVVGGEQGRVPDDVARDIGAGAHAQGGQGQAVVVEIERGEVGGQAGAILLVHVNNRIVDEDEASALLVQDGVIDVVEQVVDDRPLGVLAGHIRASGNRAGGIARIIRPAGRGVAVRIAMGVHEDVALDPGVGAVEVKMIVARAVEDIVDDLKNGTGALAAGEVDGVVEAIGVAKIIVAEDAMAAGRDSIDALFGSINFRRAVA